MVIAIDGLAGGQRPRDEPIPGIDPFESIVIRTPTTHKKWGIATQNPIEFVETLSTFSFGGQMVNRSNVKANIDTFIAQREGGRVALNQQRIFPVTRRNAQERPAYIDPNRPIANRLETFEVTAISTPEI